MYGFNLPRSGSRYITSACILILCSILLYTLSSTTVTSHLEGGLNTVVPDANSAVANDADYELRRQRIPCKGPRGALMTESYDDQIHPVRFDDVPYPGTLSGSYEKLGLDQSWLSASERYGPYGYDEESDDYSRSRVDWNQTNWANLQDNCVESNKRRFVTPYTFEHGRSRFTYRERSWKEKWLPLSFTAPKIKPRPTSQRTERTALVVRAWHTFNYTTEDLWNLRSLVAETSLATGGEYAVFILVDVKNETWNIHTDSESYDRVLHEYIPAEFRDMAVLFDSSMLESWYPDVGEHLPILQIMQPLQIFAQFYPEFDHYWQLEVDARFLGHTGDMLDRFSEFARNDPRKQARERASWAYMPDWHGTYEDFSNMLNDTLNGTSLVWGPVDIHDLDIIGPVPPVEDPCDDDFSWGVGEDADLVLLNTLEEASRDEDWLFKDHHKGFSMREELPVFVSVVAQGRASWNLLNAVHHAQAYHGMRIPSEATLPSFALWHGLKVSAVPLPVYQWPGRDRGEMEMALNGGALWAFRDGVAQGPARYRGASLGFFTNGMNWQWATSLPNALGDVWYNNDVENPNLPDMLLVRDDKMYTPNIIIHPRKTNKEKPVTPLDETSTT